MKLIPFIHYLRENGFLTTSAETTDAYRAFEILDLADETEVRLGLRAVLCSTKAEYDAFEALFDSFFQALPERGGLGGSDVGQHASQGEKAESAKRGDTKAIEASHEKSAREAVGDLSPSAFISQHAPGNADVTQERSFLQAVRQSQAEAQHAVTARVPSDDFAHMLTVATHVVRHIRLTPGRRSYPMPEGRRIDFRRTMRRSLSTGGHPVELARFGKRKHQARFVLFCDGSRSMATYATTFLQFAYALSRQAKQMELFLFSTRVKRVTHALRSVRPPQMPTFTQLGAEWGGGTRIGEALTHAMREARLRHLNKNTIVLIFSDGLDSGHPDELRQAMRVLKRCVHSVIWLNPLAATPGYEPKARGMRAALPYVDLFLAAYDAASFYQLAPCIRPGRDWVERKQ